MKDTILRVLKENGFEVKLSDLYAMNWNPVASPEDFNLPYSTSPFSLTDAQKSAFITGNYSQDIKMEHQKIKWADYILFVFPFWWGSMPAIMKGWLDRCLFASLCYDKDKIFEKGPMKGKKAMLMCSTSMPETAYRPGGMHEMTMDDRLHGITYGSLKFCGFSVLKAFYAYGIVGADEPTRKQGLIDLEKYLKDLKNIPEAIFN